MEMNLETLAECKRINMRVADINRTLKRIVSIYQEYDKKQNSLRGKIKSDEEFTKYQLKRMKKEIFENRIILRGLAVYISHLNNEKRELQKAYPKNMKKKTENQN